MKDIKSITMYSTDWCSDCVRARNFFRQTEISYKEIDIDSDQEAEKKVIEMNNGYASVPTIIFEYADGSSATLVEPGWGELQDAVGLENIPLPVTNI